MSKEKDNATIFTSMIFSNNQLLPEAISYKSYRTQSFQSFLFFRVNWMFLDGNELFHLHL